MKIEFSDNILNPNGESIKNLIVETRRISQTEFPINSQSAKLFDRKNSRTTVSFAVERAHSNEIEAIAFSTTHANSLSKFTPAYLTFLSDNNKENVRFPNATPSKIKIENDGIITIAIYEFLTESPQKSL